MKIVQLLWVVVILTVQVKVNGLLFFVFWTWITQVMKPQQNSLKEKYNKKCENSTYIFLICLRFTKPCMIDDTALYSESRREVALAGRIWLFIYGMNSFYNIYQLYINVQTCVAIDSLKTIHRQTADRQCWREQQQSKEEGESVFYTCRLIN